MKEPPWVNGGRKKVVATLNNYMELFLDWFEDQARVKGIISRLRLLESYYDVPAAKYDELFEGELRGLIDRQSDQMVKKELGEMRGFNWTAYAAASVRNAGVSDRREVQDTTHDIISKLLMGQLFRGYNPDRHGPFERRFKRSVGNAVRNVIEKQRNRRRNLPSINFGAGSISPDEIAAREPPGDEHTFDAFRQLVRDRLGELGLAVLT